MDPRERMLQQAVAEARNLVKSMEAAGGGTPEQKRELRERVDRIEEMRTEVADAKEITARLAGDVPDDEGGTGMWGAKLSQLTQPRFPVSELQTLQKALLSGSSYRAKAVQAESALGVPAGSVLDLGQIDPAVRETFRVADLIPARLLGSDGMEAGNDVTFYKPDVLATGGTAVAEAGALPQSSPTWVAVSEPIRKVAHYAHIPDEALQDWSQFQQVLGAEMLAGMIAIENSQLLVGSGVAPNLAGVFDDSRSITARAQGTDTVLDAVLKALDDVRSLGFVEPDAIVMRSSDWTAIRLAKNADDDYYLGPPTTPGIKQIDGVPVYVCSAVTSGHIYVGQFKSLRAYIRKLPVLEATNSADDDFTKDLTKVRVVERFALAVPSSAKFCDLTLS